MDKCCLASIFLKPFGNYRGYETILNLEFRIIGRLGIS